MLTYQSIEIKKPRVAVFDFTSCEGCELQLLNREENLVDFLSLLDVVNFREATTDRSDEYTIAIIEGSISRDDEIDRIKKIRERAAVLVALGSCACFGGVNKLKNAFELEMVKKEVYGDFKIDTARVVPIEDVVKVDLKIPGCPPHKPEIERIVQNVLMGTPVTFPRFPVCLECKQQALPCQYDLGRICLGPITMAGCNAACTKAGLGCWGCRGPASEPNFKFMFEIMKEKGYTWEEITEKMSLFGGFEGVSKNYES